MTDDPNADLIGYEMTGDPAGLRLTVLGTWPLNSQYVEVEVTSRGDKPVTIRPASVVRRRKLLERL